MVLGIYLKSKSKIWIKASPNLPTVGNKVYKVEERILVWSFDTNYWKLTSLQFCREQIQSQRGQSQKRKKQKRLLICNLRCMVSFHLPVRRRVTKKDRSFFKVINTYDTIKFIGLIFPQYNIINNTMKSTWTRELYETL